MLTQKKVDYHWFEETLTNNQESPVLSVTFETLMFQSVCSSDPGIVKEEAFNQSVE